MDKKTNKKILPMLVACFVFCSISFNNTTKAEAFSLDEASAYIQNEIDYVSSWFKSSSSSSDGSDNSDSSSDESTTGNDSSSDGDYSSEDITTPEQLSASLNNINTFSYQLTGKKNKKGKKDDSQLSMYLTSSDTKSTEVDVDSDYSFDLSTMKDVSSLFLLKDNNSQEEYDSTFNNEEINYDYNPENYIPSDDDSNSILSSLGIKAETALATVAGGAASLLTYIGEAKKTSASNEMVAEGYEAFKKKDDEESSDENETPYETPSNNSNSEEDSDSDSNSNSEENNDYTYHNSSSSSYHLSNADYAQIASSIANMPNMSNICEPALLSTIENFIAGTTSYWQGDSLDSLASCIITKAEKYELNPLVICAQLNQESGFTPTSSSSAGAIGIAQFMPETAASLGINPLDVEDAIEGQCKYMKSLMDSFGDYSLALAGYNAGGGAVQEYGGIPPYGETQAYVTKISSVISDLTNDYNRAS